MTCWKFLVFAVLLVAMACTALWHWHDKQKSLALQLINPAYNIARQRKYVEETQAYLASCAPPDNAILMYPTNSPDGTTLSHVTQAWVRVNTLGWFHIVAHDDEPCFWAQTNYPDVGRLALGIDNSGRLFFSREHSCEGVVLNIPPVGRYRDMEEFLSYNPFWAPVPSNWRRLAPTPPPIDIASLVIGKWTVEWTNSISGHLWRGTIEFTSPDMGRGFASVVNLIGRGYGGRSSLACSVSSADTVTFASPYSGILRLNGRDFEGTLEYPVEDTVAMDRLQRQRQANTVEVIYSHTNYFKARMWKSEL